jgi:hypothetical protein
VFFIRETILELETRNLVDPVICRCRKHQQKHNVVDEQNCTNVLMSCITSLMQLSFSIASTTEWFFLLLCMNRVGNIAASDIPSSQLDVQNFALLPLYTITWVAAVNRA